MPYANIHWIKLQLELLNDKRFIFDCNNDQKWLFIGLLLLAGSTQNSTPNDEKFLKNRLNLPENESKIRENLDFLLKTFPKMVNKEGVIKFKNFNNLHNRLGISKGTPKELQRDTQIRIDKIRIDKIILHYIKKQGWEESIRTNPALQGDIYKRNVRPAKQLLLVANNDDLALKVISTMAETYKLKNLSWTLETVIRHFAEMTTKKAQVQYV